MKFMLAHTRDHLKVSINVSCIWEYLHSHSHLHLFIVLSEIDIGSENPHKPQDLQKISALNKLSRITSLNWGDENEILIGRANKFVKIYDANAGDFTSNVEMIDGPIVGLARYNGRIIAGIENGKVQIFAETPAIIETGDHMSKMRQCKEDGKLIVTGGKERQNKLKVWDLETQTKIFESKNVKNDFLQLEVPIWDTDVTFSNQHTLASCSRYGYIRLFDLRINNKIQQRRPILEYVNEKEHISYNCLATHDQTLYAATSSGIVRAFDVRKMKTILHTYKGFTGSISDMGVDSNGDYLFTSCLDRFVRVHSTKSPTLLYQCFVKSKATKILLHTKKETELDDSDCLFMGEVDDEKDDDDMNEEVHTENNTADADPEYDELFDKMQTVE